MEKKYKDTVTLSHHWKVGKELTKESAIFGKSEIYRILLMKEPQTNNFTI